MKVEILVDYLLIYQDLDVRVGVICSLLIRASAYDLRYGTDDGFAEFGVKANCRENYYQETADYGD